MAPLDWAILAIYAVVVLAAGMVAQRGVSNQMAETDYFLAGRTQGWASVAVSTWATKLSALTFIGVPGAAIAGNFAYVQLWFGSFFAAYLVARWFVPAFYQYRVFTVYEYLGHRIGPRSRLGGTFLFIISRCLASGVRLAGCAIAVSVFFDLTLFTAILLIATVAMVYVLCGGLRAVIWTDVLQLVLFLAGAAIAIIYVASTMPSGLAAIVEAGNTADKFRIFDFGLDLSDGTTFWAGNLFALILGLAVGAADQDIAQRALACPDAATARRALIVAGAADLISTLLFLFVGVAVFAFYQANMTPAVTDLIAQGRYDYVFPHFIRHELPAGIRGLLVAALLAAAMSSLDSALSGLASSAHFDLGIRRLTDDKTASRWLVIVFAAILAGIAALLGGTPSILWFGLKIMGYTYGGLLGLFILAHFAAMRIGDTASVVAAFSSVVVVVVATTWDLGLGLLPWPWSIVLGLGWTIAIALIAGQIMPRNAVRQVA